MTSKPELRKAYRGLLSQDLAAADLERATSDLNARLVSHLSDETGTWAAFQPHGFEPDIRPALQKLTKLRWAYPRIEGDSQAELAFYVPASKDRLVKGGFGILEPDPNQAEKIELAELKGLLIPGLAFDSKCNRLGRGRGFYDRTLSAIPKTSRPRKVGIAFDRQVSQDPLPVESFDVAMDEVVTESRTYERKTS
jgi:5-formyltetrahydrofolate cyclo-ligase